MVAPIEDNINIQTIQADIHNTQGSYYQNDQLSQSQTSGIQSFRDAVQSQPNNLSQVEREEREIYRAGESFFDSSPVSKEINSMNNILEIFEKRLKKIVQDIVLKMGSFLEETFTLKLHTEAPRQRKQIISSLIRNHFGQSTYEEYTQQGDQDEMENEDNNVEEENVNNSTKSKNKISKVNKKPDPTSKIPQVKQKSKTLRVTSRNKQNSKK